MENSSIIIVYLHIYGLITDPHNDLFSVGLIAQLAQHRYRRGQGSNPRSGQKFLSLFSLLLKQR